MKILGKWHMQVEGSDELEAVKRFQKLDLNAVCTLSPEGGLPFFRLTMGLWSNKSPVCTEQKEATVWVTLMKRSLESLSLPTFLPANARLPSNEMENVGAGLNSFREVLSGSQ